MNREPLEQLALDPIVKTDFFAINQRFNLDDGKWYIDVYPVFDGEIVNNPVANGIYRATTFTELKNFIENNCTVNSVKDKDGKIISENLIISEEDDITTFRSSIFTNGNGKDVHEYQGSSTLRGDDFIQNNVNVVKCMADSAVGLFRCECTETVATILDVNVPMTRRHK
jgi:hypothetical protein